MTTTGPSAPRLAVTGGSPPAGRLPGILVVAGFATFLVTVVVLHVVQLDKDPRHDWVSDYANGRGGWLLSIAFLGAAAGLFGLALGVARCVQPSRAGTVAAVAFGVASLGAVAQSVLASDPPRADGSTGYTAVGAMHDLAGFASAFAVIVGLFALARACRRDPDWAGTARGVRCFAWLSIVGLTTEFVVGELSTVRPDGDGVAGLIQRIDLAVWMTGAILLGLRLLNRDRPANPHTDAAAA